MTAEIDEDGVEIAGDGYDWGRDARELVPELRAEIERLRAEREAHIGAVLAEIAELEVALNYFLMRDPDKPFNWMYRQGDGDD